MDKKYHKDQYHLQHRFYRRVAIDVDSCLTGVEGINLLSKIKGVGEAVANITNDTMNGDIPFNVALNRRLKIIQPNRSNFDIVSQSYIKNSVSDAPEVIGFLKKNGVDVLLLSGGFRISIEPLAEYVGVPKQNIYANNLFFGEKGEYLGFDENNFLSQKEGKRKQIEKLRDKKNGLFAIVGDSVSELETKPVTDFRIGFGGFVIRQRVLKEADVFLSEPTFLPLILLLLNHQRIRKIFYGRLEDRVILIKAFESMSRVKFNRRAKLLQKSIMKLKLELTNGIVIEYF